MKGREYDIFWLLKMFVYAEYPTKNEVINIGVDILCKIEMKPWHILNKQIVS